MRRTLLFLLAASISLSPMSAGVKIRMLGGSASGTPDRVDFIYIDGPDRLRLDGEVDSESGVPQSSVIFRNDLKTIFQVDHDSQEYMVLDESTVREMSSRLDRAIAEMQEQISQLPEGQRKVMEDMVRMNLPSEDFRVEVRELGEDAGNRKYEILVGGEGRTHVWVASPESLGLPPETMTVFQNLGDFYEVLMDALKSSPFLSALGANPFPGFARLNGVPVRILQLQENDESRLQEAAVEALDSSLFEPPASYTRVKPDEE